MERANWSGRLDATDFLSRIWDLEKLPSQDGRFTSAAGDIWQHTVNNPLDWPDDWIFADSRFNLLACDDDIFLRFLCEMVHPVVRPDAQEAQALVQLFNDSLVHAGFEIVARSRLAGRTVWAPRSRIEGLPAPVSKARDLAESFNADYMVQQIARIESAVPHDPDLAIGTAKELVETCCKTIIEARNVSIPENADLPKLVKLTCQTLKLTPADIPDDAKAADTIKRLLSNLATVTHGLAELRNHYGTGHGRSGKARGLRPRHARLAAGAAVTLVVFLFETHDER